MTEDLAAIIWAVGLVAWFAIRLPYQRRARKIRVADAQRTLSERLVLPAAGIGLSVIPALYLATGIFGFADYRFRAWMGWCGFVVEVLFLSLIHI